MKVGIFGCGYIYSQYKEYIQSNDEIVAVIDNDVNKHETEIEGVKCIYPREYSKIQMDIIILMSDSADEMKRQLMRCGCPEKIIVHYKDYLGKILDKKKFFIISKKCVKDKKLLIITNDLGYHGGPIVAMRTGKCAIELGYDVTVAASKGQEKIIKEFNSNGINVIIQEWLMHSPWENLQWVDDYDSIIVNTYPMIKCAIEISKHRDVVLWLHESVGSYYELEFWHAYISKGLKNKGLKLYAVTRRACENFYRFYGDKVKVEVLSLAIEDWKRVNYSFTQKKILTYALIGRICKAKGQDIFLKAIKGIQNRQNKQYIIVGRVDKNKNSESIRNELCCEESILLLGERTQEEIKNILYDVDIVVVPSREESFSMVAAEAMMMEKVCIISDNCGISDYIEDGKNGLIFRSENADDLRKIMMWCENHREELSEIGKNARESYEHYFTTEIHKRRLEEIL